MTGMIRATYHASPQVRESLVRMASKLGMTQGQVLTEALRAYQKALKDGTKERPGRRDPVGRDVAERITVHCQPAIRDWITARSQDWNVPLGHVVAGAVEYYETVRPAPKAKAAKSKEKKSQPTMARPSKSPVLTDRAECRVCLKQVDVNGETSLLVDHIAHPSVRPRGVYQLCDGSGKKPAGRVIHGADMTTRTS